MLDRMVWLFQQRFELGKIICAPAEHLTWQDPAHCFADILCGCLLSLA
jgi:hypothetical protein